MDRNCSGNFFVYTNLWIRVFLINRNDIRQPGEAGKTRVLQNVPSGLRRMGR